MFGPLLQRRKLLQSAGHALLAAPVLLLTGCRATQSPATTTATTSTAKDGASKWASGGTARIGDAARFPTAFAAAPASACMLTCMATIGPCHTTAPERSASATVERPAAAPRAARGRCRLSARVRCDRRDLAHQSHRRLFGPDRGDVQQRSGRRRQALLPRLPAHGRRRTRGLQHLLSRVVPGPRRAHPPACATRRVRRQRPRHQRGDHAAAVPMR